MLWSAPYCIGWTTERQYFTLKTSYDKTTESVGMGCLQKKCFETTWLVKKNNVRYALSMQVYGARVQTLLHRLPA